MPYLFRFVRIPHRSLFGVLVGVLGVVAFLLSQTGIGGNAIANGDTRELSIYHTHTGESLRIEYKKNGAFDRDALEKLNWLLRDWRRDEPTSMDPRLFDLVWEAHRLVGSHEPIHIVSAYRSPETNAMLRRRSKMVAKNSQHMRGKAMDFYLPDASVADIREIGLKMQRGGVGYYPTAYTPFVHLDTGSVRHWPRMTHDELARIFPDGKTVHIPSDGKPLDHFAEAEAEILANGGTVMGTSFADAGEESAPTTKPKSLWAFLFGDSSEDEDSDIVSQKPVTRTASAKEATKDAASADMTDENGATAGDKETTSVVALPAKLAQIPLAALPTLSSFRMAVPAPGTPLPMPRPGSVPVATAALGTPSQPALIWQTGPLPIEQGSGPIPLPPIRQEPPFTASLSAAVAPVPLPPVRRIFSVPASVKKENASITGSPEPSPRITSAIDPLVGKPTPTRVALTISRDATSALAAHETTRIPTKSKSDTTNTPAITVALFTDSQAAPSTAGFSNMSNNGPTVGRFAPAASCATTAFESQPCMPRASR